MEVEGAEIQAPSDHAEPKNKDNQDSTKGSSRKKRKQREFALPALDRPARERKSIERLIISPDKEIKEFKIQQGSGTALKDIPNIVFKLSKRRAGDEVVQALHRVLFRRTSVKHAKGEILQFSGFVWSGDEEKEKAKVKEKLERCVKENLFQISDLLDLHLHKSIKKEDAVLKIFEFLESPCKTTDKLVEEKVKSKRGRKAKKTPGKESKTKAKALGKSPKKSHKGAKKTSRKKQSSDEEDESDAAEFDEDIEEEPQDKSDKSDDDYAKESSSVKKRKRKSPKKEAVQESKDEEETSPKKKKPRKEVKKGKKEPIREAKKEKKPKKKAPKVEEPSDEDLREAICELLENADFSKVTFTDVMKQLGEKFNADLTHRKAQLKAMIQEEIHKLVGEGDNEDEDGDNEGEIDDNGDKANGDDPEEHEDASGDVKAEEDASGEVKAEEKDARGEVKADDEEEDGDGNVAEGDGDEEEDVDDAKPADVENEDEDRNSIEDKPDDEDEGKDAKEEKDHEARVEEGMTDTA